ncbi:MAG: sigma-70 family RNA polymerase sigma factor [Saprospiraceae bacterium]|nr:sigma-70 family RNA polymerase sigma factor [Saprospiraceae bacterium]MBK8485729.1 sigma-70 family RNA polymerase sigma factor [Saprospiraceae bacterium]MBK9222955.1 sigma-70 family RNA polymerase sigma factor [Saprospiraceae bacterium]MBK9720003.1 sigma-70 family RNA polymerase sigma factor [Saprospiraceae bacterium]MBK9726984.1 sigma-70 family RNA polymerase sigma factor [Saprospiraceae bacterium]
MDLEQIIQGCLQGDRISQKNLFDRFSGKMLAVCSRYARHRMEAEDLLQDGFIKVYSNLDQYKFEGPFEQWIRRIMINNAIKNCHRKSFQNEYFAGDDIPEMTEEPDILSSLAEIELMKIINELPDGYRMVFNLYAIEGYSHKEISESLNIEESTSRSQLVKARKVLQEKLLKYHKTII